MEEKKDFINAFAQGLLVFVKSFNNAPQGLLKRRLKESIMSILRAYSDRYTLMASEKAKKLAESYEMDIFEMLWPNRYDCGSTEVTKGNRTITKSNLVMGHTMPINIILHDILQCNTIQCITDTLNSYSGVCWITRAEDDILNKNGFKNKRPNGWEACYRLCDISIIDRIQENA